MIVNTPSMNTKSTRRAPAGPAGALVVLGLALCAWSCGNGVERAEITAKVHAEDNELRQQNMALLTENARLRAALLGRQPWTGTLQLRRVGGASGTVPFARMCPRGEAMAGFQGQAGAVVDGLGPLCTPLGRDALEGLPDAAATATELDFAGGTGGSAFSRTCKAGSHLVGFRGRAGDGVDAIEPVCRDLRVTPVAEPTDEKPAPPPATSLPSIGGSGGEPFERICPAGWVLVGLSGRYGKFLTSLVPHCGRLGTN